MLPSRGRRILLLSLVGMLLATWFPVATSVEVHAVLGRLPEERFSFASAQIDDRGYILGGRIAEESYSDDVLVVRRDSSVSRVGDLPGAVSDAAAAAAGGKVYVFGGVAPPLEGSNLPVMSASIYVFDPATGDSSTLLTASLPAGVADLSAVRLGAYIYVFGGWSLVGVDGPPVLDYKDTIVRFDPSTNDVDTLEATLPSGRAYMAAVSTGDAILLVGGYGETRGDAPCPHDDAVCVSDEVLRFTPSTGEVEPIGTLPAPSRWGSAAYYDGLVYALGGCQNACGAYTGLDTIVEIDPDTGDAVEIPVHLPATGGRSGVFLFDDMAYLPGGSWGTTAEAFGEPGRDIYRVELGATRPWAPYDLTSERLDNGAVKLSWHAPTYDGGSPLLSYEIFRGAGGADLLRIAEVEETEYTDRATRLGTTYIYRVRATNLVSVSSLGNAATVTPSAPPDAPELAAYGGNGKIFVQWTTPPAEGGAPPLGYRLYAKPDGGDEVVWGEVSALYAVVDFIAGEGPPLENGKTYSFRVQARNDHGWGALSPVDTAVPSAVPDPPGQVGVSIASVDGRAAVDVRWSTNPSLDVTGYRIYRGASLAELTPIADVGSMFFTDASELPRGVRLYYAVASLAGDIVGPLSPAGTVAFVGAPSAVQNLGARWTGTDILVWWDEPADARGKHVNGYDVAITQGAIDPASANATVYGVPASPYSDQAPPRGVPLVYHVRAVGEGGASGWEMVQVRVPLTEDSLPPTPVLIVDPSRPAAGQDVVLDASSSSDDEGVVAYSFDFGDGNETGWTSSPRVKHAYEHPGVYSAKLTVRDLRGLESPKPAAVVIAVGPAPPTPNEDDFDPVGETNGSPVPWVAALVALAGAAGVLRRRA